MSGVTLARGKLLMCGETVERPPLDINGDEIALGSTVWCNSDTLCSRRERAFPVAALRLQERHGELEWVICSHDDAGCYLEAWARECRVTRPTPRPLPTGQPIGQRDNQ